MFFEALGWLGIGLLLAEIRLLVGVQHASWRSGVLAISAVAALLGGGATWFSGLSDGRAWRIGAYDAGSAMVAAVCAVVALLLLDATELPVNAVVDRVPTGQG
jgi:hypothetical protein